MKKKVMGKKLSRGQGARRALFRSLIKALVEHSRIVTTKAKAKTISPQIDKLVSLSKRNSVSAKRRLYRVLGNDRKTAEDLGKKIAPLFMDRGGGYTRIVNLPQRRGDLASMARIEWVKEVIPEGKLKSKKEPVSKKEPLTKRLIKLPGRKTKEEK